MINQVTLVGRLTKDPVKRTSGDKTVANFTLAVNRSFKNSEGVVEADFINVVVWGKSAVNVEKFVKKGSLVGVTGSLRTGSYEKDGQRVYTTEVLADLNGVTFLDTKNSKTNENQEGNSQSTPQNTQNTQSTTDDNTDPFSSGSGPIEVSDDDLPF